MDLLTNFLHESMQILNINPYPCPNCTSLQYFSATILIFSNVILFLFI